MSASGRSRSPHGGASRQALLPARALGVPGPGRRQPPSRRRRPRGRPASHAASARAAATGPSLGNSRVGSARAHASSSSGHTSGSPRRARTSASTISARMRGVVEVRGIRSTTVAESLPPPTSAPGRAQGARDGEGGRDGRAQSLARCKRRCPASKYLLAIAARRFSTVSAASAMKRPPTWPSRPARRARCWHCSSNSVVVPDSLRSRRAHGSRAPRRRAAQPAASARSFHAIASSERMALPQMNARLAYAQASSGLGGSSSSSARHGAPHARLPRCGPGTKGNWKAGAGRRPL